MVLQKVEVSNQNAIIRLMKQININLTKIYINIESNEHQTDAISCFA